ncbi:MAG: hypothetical protein ABSF90_17760 [Syntrophobacteraceae bacterium]|jgi:hypothetical protein
MGDRTHVSIQIRKIDYEWLLRAEFNDDPEQMRETLYYEYLEFQDDIVDFEANEINYGEWDELEGLLYAHSIEYDKTWGAGGDYAGGASYNRLVAGKMQEVQIYEGSEDFVLFLKEVKDLEPAEIKRRVQEMYRKVVPFDIISLSEDLPICL